MFIKSFFSNLYLFLSFILFFNGTGFSQSASYLDSLDGKFALQFQISDNFSLSSFQGTTLSGKYHFSKRDAIRLGISIDLDDSDEEVSNNIEDTVNVYKYKNDKNVFGITVNTQYIRYITGTDDIYFFGGGGPFFRYLSLISNKNLTQSGGSDKSKSTVDSYSIGIDLLLGVEWWFHNYMSLSAEYGMKFMYTSQESKNERGVVKVEITEDNFRITANSINFGITVYF